jgi:uncharacterized phage protein (TIGR01671 family)
MREIKFRAWNGKNMENWDSLSCPSISVPELFCTGDYELMQYTELKDKNGKEIYENDICRIYAARVPQYNNSWQTQSQFDTQSIEVRVLVIFRYGQWIIEADNDYNKKILELKGNETEKRHLIMNDELFSYDMFYWDDWKNKNWGYCSHHDIIVIGNKYENPELLK